MKILFNKYISKDKLFLTFGSIFMLIAVLSFVFFNINDEKLLRAGNFSISTGKFFENASVKKSVSTNPII